MPIALALGVLQSTRTARKCTTGCKVHHLNHCKVTVRCKASYESCNGSKRFMPHKSESSRRDSLPCEDSHDTGGNSYRMLTTPKTYVHIPLSHTPVTGGRLRTGSWRPDVIVHRCEYTQRHTAATAQTALAALRPSVRMASPSSEGRLVWWCILHAAGATPRSRSQVGGRIHWAASGITAF